MVLKLRRLPEKIQFSGCVHCLEPVQKLTPEQARHDPSGKEILVRSLDPGFAIGGKTSTRYNAVQVGMQRQVLPPCVQNGNHTGLCAQPSYHPLNLPQNYLLQKHIIFYSNSTK